MPRSFYSSESACDGFNAQHTSSNATFLSVNFCNGTSGEIYSSNNENVQFRYQMNLSNDFVEVTDENVQPTLELIEYQCVALDLDSNTLRPLMSSGGKPNDIIINPLEAISSLFLSLTLIFLVVARFSRDKIPQPPILSRADIRGNKFLVEFCVCFSLLLMHTFIAVAKSPWHATNHSACRFIAAGMHYSLLAAAIWLLNQGISLAMKVSNRFSLSFDYRILTGLQIAFGWGVPLLIVGFIAGLSAEDYVATNRFVLQVNNRVFKGKTFPEFIDCFFNFHGNKASFVSVVATISIIVIINIIVVGRTVAIVRRISKNDVMLRHAYVTDRCSSKFKSEKYLVKIALWRTTGKALLLLLPVSTIPWIIWMLALIGEDAAAVAFAASSGVQGIAIFIIVCVINADDRGRILRLWKQSRIRERLLRTFSDVLGRRLQQNKRKNQV